MARLAESSLAKDEKAAGAVFAGHVWPEDGGFVARQAVVGQRSVAGPAGRMAVVALVAGEVVPDTSARLALDAHTERPQKAGQALVQVAVHVVTRAARAGIGHAWPPYVSNIQDLKSPSLAYDTVSECAWIRRMA